MTAVPPEKVGTRNTDELYGGVPELGTRLFASRGGSWTVRVPGRLVTEPAEFVTVTVKSEPVSPATVGGVVYELEVAPLMVTPFLNH
jgi:hypothetical protein